MKRMPGNPAGKAGGRARLGAALRALLLALWALGQGAGHQGCDAPEVRAQGGPPVLYVYLHTDSKFAELERVLKSQLPALAVTVFGRFRDFEEAMQARPPDAVLGIGALLNTLDLPPALQGLRGGVDWETYALLSPDAALDTTAAGKVIGAVDLLGRTATQAFVAQLVGSDDIKLKRVTKLEDLLPLLQLSAADGVVAPAATVRGIIAQSRLPLRMRELPQTRVKLPAVGVRNAAGRDLVVKQIQRMDGATNRTLGVDAWRTP